MCETVVYPRILSLNGTLIMLHSDLTAEKTFLLENESE